MKTSQKTFGKIFEMLVISLKILRRKMNSIQEALITGSQEIWRLYCQERSITKGIPKSKTYNFHCAIQGGHTVAKRYGGLRKALEVSYPELSFDWRGTFLVTRFGFTLFFCHSGYCFASKHGQARIKRKGIRKQKAIGRIQKIEGNSLLNSPKKRALILLYLKIGLG